VAGALLNDVLQSKDYCIRDGDVIKLITVIGGG